MSRCRGNHSEFVEEFYETIKKFFKHLIYLIHGKFLLFEELPGIMSDFFSDLVDK
jgi:hypothetical protein